MNQAQQAWDDRAAGWIANADYIEATAVQVQRWLIDHLDPKPGETFLDLAAGAGDVGFAIAERVGPNGRVISTDISPHMSQAARQRAEDRGITNIEFRIVDAERIDLDDASVDGVVHRYGPMLLVNPADSFAGVRRVLKDGGLYATVVWGSPADNPWIPMMGAPLLERGLLPPGASPFDPGGMFSLADHDALRTMLEGAGFTDITIEEVDHPQTPGSFEQLWKIPSEIAGPLANVISGLPDDEREAVRVSLRSSAEPFREGEGYRIPGRAVCALAR